MGRDVNYTPEPNPYFISIHTPRVGRDKDFEEYKRTCEKFQSTRPVWGVTAAKYADYSSIKISIHTPRVGRDSHTVIKTTSQRKFQSTRPVWGVTSIIDEQADSTKFQSTRPVWGVTKMTAIIGDLTDDFNPHAPCGA